MSSHLPDGAPLAYGAATAAYQIEGAVTEDGRGPSIWDTFAARAGTIRDGSDGSVACDSYHRLDEDLDLVAGLGAGWYRFSIAWPRIMPEGSGAVETARAGLLRPARRRAAGARRRARWPRSTTGTCRSRWRTAAAGWTATPPRRSPTTPLVVHDRLGDRVRLWATHNEPWCAAYLGYAAGMHAPGPA